MSIRSRLGDVRRRVLSTYYRRDVPLGKIGPIVSFTFDDFPRSACENGGGILEDFGVRGTYYVTFGLMNSCNELGELFRVSDLRTLMEKRHEVGTHTYNHSSCRTLSLLEFRRDVERGKHVIEELIGHDSINFAYPYGDVTLKAKKYVAPLLRSCRGIVPGLNGPQVDLNLLRANELYGGTAKILRAQRLIKQNTERQGWLIFYTHDVRLSPSAYGCTPALFEATVRHAVASGSRVLTVQAALLEMGLTEATKAG